MTASRGWGRQGPDSPLLPPEETNPALILAFKTYVGLLTSRTVRESVCVLF